MDNWTSEARYRFVNKLFYLKNCRPVGASSPLVPRISAAAQNLLAPAIYDCYLFLFCFFRLLSALATATFGFFLALTAFLGVADRGVGLEARAVLGASLVFILLGILLKGHQPNNIACSVRRKGLGGTGKIDFWSWEVLYVRWWTHRTAGLIGNSVL